MDSGPGAAEPLAPASDAALAPPAPRRDPLGAGGALLLYVLYFAGQLVIGVVLGLIAAFGVSAGDHGERAVGLSPELVMGAVVAGVLLGAWFVLEVAMRWSPPRAGGLAALDISWSTKTRRQIILANLAKMLLAVLWTVSAPWFISRWPSAEPGPALKAARHSHFTLAAWSGLALLVAPPVEELLFRGLMLRGLTRSWGPFAAGLCVTALFVASHVFDIGFFVPGLMVIAALGCATLAARAATHALGPAIALHAGYNLVIVVVATVLMA